MPKSIPILFRIETFYDLENGVSNLFQIGSFVIVVKSEYHYSLKCYDSIKSSIKRNSGITPHKVLSSGITKKKFFVESGPIGNVNKLNESNEINTDNQSVEIEKSYINVNSSSNFECLLHISINSKNYDCQTYSISSTKKIVSIGRSQSCNIVLDNPDVSKIHCRIVYNYQTKKWRIYDGSQTAASSYGTWLVVKSKCLIQKGKNELRYGNSKFILDNV